MCASEGGSRGRLPGRSVPASSGGGGRMDGCEADRIGLVGWALLGLCV
jgi:hypothetical protein